MTKELKNVRGVPIGRIEEQGDIQILYNNHGVELGTYDAKTDETRNARDVKIGYGISLQGC